MLAGVCLCPLGPVRDEAFIEMNEWMNDRTRLHASAQTSSQSAIFAVDVLLLQRVISCRKISTLQFFIVVNAENNK